MFDFILLDFIILAYTLGPMVTITYGIQVLGMTPTQIFLALTALGIIPIPLLFKIFEFGGRHKELYRMKILKKFSATTDRQLEEILEQSDSITRMFQKKMGYKGFYAAIVIVTFIFGIWWASLVSYILLIKRKRAILCISAGVVLGNLFWLMVTVYSESYVVPVGILAVFTAIPLIIYGRKKEKEIIHEISEKLKLKKHSTAPGFSLKG